MQKKNQNKRPQEDLTPRLRKAGFIGTLTSKSREGPPSVKTNSARMEIIWGQHSKREPERLTQKEEYVNTPGPKWLQYSQENGCGAHLGIRQGLITKQKPLHI
jgi:hypothetical protein